VLFQGTSYLVRIFIVKLIGPAKNVIPASCWQRVVRLAASTSVLASEWQDISSSGFEQLH